MARIRKENMNTSFFHTMVQGINKEYIFESIKDRNQYLKIMKETREKIDITILAYCIMSNHAHILFYEQNKENLTKYMHRINLLYAKYYNKKYDRVGYVFRDRYKTQPIYSEKYLYMCVKYIHNNPIKANICKEANEYRYSSCHHNIFYRDTELERNIKNNMYVQQTKREEEQNFILMEEDFNKEEICNQIIKEIAMENHITKEEICQSNERIGLLIKKLKIQNNISYRMLESVLGINRKKLKRIEQEQIEGKTDAERLENE